MKSESSPRSYRQGARAEAAEATYERILDAFMARLGDSWFDQITLDDIAAAAGVSVQTIVRRFGGKEGLIEAACKRLETEITDRRVTKPGEVGEALDLLVSDYELTGDLVMRLLAQEDRSPALRSVTDRGRAGHRAWLAQAFGPQLSRWSGSKLTFHLDLLVAATDVYLWKLVRRDMGRSLDDYKSMLRHLVAGAFAPLASG